MSIDTHVREIKHTELAHSRFRQTEAVAYRQTAYEKAQLLHELFACLCSQ
jgi:hypothetical protein